MKQLTSFIIVFCQPFIWSAVNDIDLIESVQEWIKQSAHHKHPTLNLDQAINQPGALKLPSSDG